ncbi:MAG: MATE family efflux transporter [Phycisphaerales bacterium]|nr:MATE family efflux transporter [Planctomycetota bacterium]MCH8509636.1 MATE family efflux transporter [Phycisphaerales bacterium]
MSDHESASPPERPGHAHAPAPPESQPPGEAVPVPIDRENPLRELVKIAAPSVATMSSYTVMQFVDKLMVSRIGPEPVYVAAQSNGGILAWTMMTFCVGVAGVVSSFVSQNLGAGRPERGSAYAWTSMWIGLGYWMAVMMPAVFLVPRLFAWMHADAPDLIAYETQYAQIVIAGGVFTLMAKGMHNYFFGLHRPGIVMLAVVGANLLNIFITMVLVFGHEGFPIAGETERLDPGLLWLAGGVTQAAAWTAGVLGIEPMGIRGAALGTVFANLMEWLIPMAVFLGPGMARKYATRIPWRPSRLCLKDLFRVGWPAGLMFVNELICWFMLMVWLVPAGGRARAAAMGLDEETVRQAGVVANTAGWITLQWMHLAFMPTVGISIATQAMVGKAIGAGRQDIAAARTWLCAKIAVGYMGLCALAFVLFRSELTAVFINEGTDPAVAEEMVRLGGWLLIGAAVFQVFDALAIITSAALRGAGDTVWPGIVTVVLSWTLIVGVGYGLIVVAPGLGAIGPWIGASLYISVLGVVLVWRFVGGRWKTLSLVRKDPETDPEPVPEAEILANPGPGPDPTSGMA